MEAYMSMQAVSTQIGLNNSSILSHRTHDNLLKKERLALNSLRQRTDIIIIKPADKGLAAAVVKDRQIYIDEAAMRQLNDPY